MRKYVGKVYCSNCNKGLHNTPKAEQCHGGDCACRCRTHFEDEDGAVIPFGMKKDENKTDAISKSDKKWDKKLEEARKVFGIKKEKGNLVARSLEKTK